MENNHTIIKIILITLLLFISLDLLVGRYVYKKLVRSDFVDIDTSFGVRDNVYDHKFKPNYNVLTGWGKSRYRLCTDSNGFRSSCNNQFQNFKDFDIGFIGDSFTEPVGLNYEESFVGIISSHLKKKKIANLAVTSYSPSIYYSKINFLLSKSYKFKEIIVFIDLSDMVDDTVCYKLNNNIVERRKSFLKCYDQELTLKDKIEKLFRANFKLTYESYKIINNKLTDINLTNYEVPHSVTNHPRSDWTHDYKQKNYNNFSYEKSINILLLNMQKLANLLKDNEIDLSVAVYPWPGTLKYDIHNNRHLNVWKDFCISNCKNFYDFMIPFYDLLKHDSFTNVYKKVYIENDQHFNEEGNKIIAESFLKLYKD